MVASPAGVAALVQEVVAVGERVASPAQTQLAAAERRVAVGLEALAAAEAQAVEGALDAAHLRVEVALLAAVGAPAACQLQARTALGLVAVAAALGAAEHLFADSAGDFFFKSVVDVKVDDVLFEVDSLFLVVVVFNH